MKYKFIWLSSVFFLLNIFLIKSAFCLTFYTVDWKNYWQNYQILQQNIQQTKQEIEQTTLLYKQYEHMAKNAKMPSEHIWDDINATIDNINNATATLDVYKKQLGNLQAFLNKYKMQNDYEKAIVEDPNYIEILEEQNSFREEVKRKTTDDLIKIIDEQKKAINRDAEQIKKLQKAAAQAEGNLEAISYQNQLLAEQAHQLMQLRGAMLAQQAAIAAHLKAQADEKAQKDAATKQLADTSTFKPYTGPSQWLKF